MMASRPQTTPTISTAMSASLALRPSLPPRETSSSPADVLEVVAEAAAAAVLEASAAAVPVELAAVEEGRVVMSEGYDDPAFLTSNVSEVANTLVGSDTLWSLIV